MRPGAHGLIKLTGETFCFVVCTPTFGRSLAEGATVATQSAVARTASTHPVYRFARTRKRSYKRAVRRAAQSGDHQPASCGIQETAANSSAARPVSIAHSVVECRGIVAGIVAGTPADLGTYETRRPSPND